MNTIYRLVFNRALRVWQVASELVKGGGGLVGHVPGRQSAALSPLGFALMCSLGWVSLERLRWRSPMRASFPIRMRRAVNGRRW